MDSQSCHDGRGNDGKGELHFDDKTDFGFWMLKFRVAYQVVDEILLGCRLFSSSVG